MRIQRFTLIELLVVISIIGILSSILLPSLSRARDRVNQKVSVSNLRQIGVAFNVYASDAAGEIPSYLTWYHDTAAVFDFTDLDSSQAKQAFTYPGAGLSSNVIRSYSCAETLKGIDSNRPDRPTAQKARKVDQIYDPSNAVLVIEGKVSENAVKARRAIAWNSANADFTLSSPQNTTMVGFPYFEATSQLRGDFSVQTTAFSGRYIFNESMWKGIEP